MGSPAIPPKAPPGVSQPNDIVVHVVSPSLEVAGKLTFSNVSVSTTITDIKKKIRDAVPTRPLPERQRLIWQGKPLSVDNVTLRDAIGHEAIDRSRAVTLHLVLPPAPNISANLANTVNLSRHSPHSPAVQRPESINQLPRGDSESEFVTARSSGLATDPSLQTLSPNHQGQLPPHMREQLDHHFLSLSQPIGFNHINRFESLQRSLHNHPRHTSSLSSHDLSGFQHLLTQQQQARAAAGNRGISTRNGSLVPRTESASERTEGAENSDLFQGIVPSNSSSITQVNESTAAFPLPESKSQAHDSTRASPVVDLPRVMLPVIGQSPSTEQLPQGNRPTKISRNDTSGLTNALNQMQWQLNAFEMALNGAISSGNHQEVPPEIEIYRMRSQLVDLARHPVNGEILLSLSNRLNDLALRAVAVRKVSVEEIQDPEEGTTARPLASPSVPPSTIYLLSSPSGPRALLLSPVGAFATPGLDSPSHDSLPLVFTSHPMRSLMLGTAGSDASSSMAGPSSLGSDGPVAAEQYRGEPIRNRFHVPPGVDDVRPDREEQQPDQARNILRILLPFGDRLWFLVRLLGFVYFFASGASWYRTLMLVTIAIIVFLSQTELFRPVQQLLWEPVQRHFEGLAPLGGNVGAVQPNADRIGGDRQGLADAPPSPRDMALRLLNERNEQVGGVLRRNLRRAERATALFIASLVPGVGERHIAAQDAATAAIRQAEETEQAEVARLEEERASLSTGAESAPVESSSVTAGEAPKFESEASTQQAAAEL